jgi:hypothetical protein
MDTDGPRAAIDQDMSSGRPAIAVVGNAGTTNTGSVEVSSSARHSRMCGGQQRP